MLGWKLDWLDSQTGKSVIFLLVCALILGRAVYLFLRWADHGPHPKRGAGWWRGLLCGLGRHKRSMSQRFRDDGGVYRSYCRGCRKPMRKLANGRWVKDAK